MSIKELNFQLGQKEEAPAQERDFVQHVHFQTDEVVTVEGDNGVVYLGDEAFPVKPDSLGMKIPSGVNHRLVNWSSKGKYTIAKVAPPGVNKDRDYLVFDGSVIFKPRNSGRPEILFGSQESLKKGA